MLMAGLLKGYKKLAYASLFWLATAMPVAAQISKPSEKFICYMPIGTMPELASGGGMKGIVSAIQRQVIYPPRAEKDNIEGRVLVSFTVSSKGIIHDVRVVKSLRHDCDSVVVQAVNRLPRLKPGREAGAPVAVGFTVPVTFRLEEATDKAKSANHK